MMRAIGFLAGVGLTLGAFLLVLKFAAVQPLETGPGPAADTHPAGAAEMAETGVADAGRAARADAPAAAEQPGDAQTGSSQGVGDAGPEALSTLLAAVAQQVDALPAGGASEPASAPPGEQRPAAPEAGESRGGSGLTVQPDGDAPAAASPGSDGAGSGTYVFWSPFRSAWAAQGFAQRLTAATQVPVEVVDGGARNYRVAFGYRDEAQRRARIERIEAITGLELE